MHIWLTSGAELIGWLSYLDSFPIPQNYLVMVVIELQEQENASVGGEKDGL
jgi:hypothetical protein